MSNNNGKITREVFRLLTGHSQLLSYLINAILDAYRDALPLFALLSRIKCIIRTRDTNILELLNYYHLNEVLLTSIFQVSLNIVSCKSKKN